jgi:methylated-DNA-[protein]-cysteine S-methyltransferase
MPADILTYSCYLPDLGTLVIRERQQKLLSVVWSDDISVENVVAPPTSQLGRKLTELLYAYVRGERVHFINLPFEMTGSIWMQSVLHVVSKIPYGCTMSYGEVARSLNCPLSSRAVGQALNRNPFCVLIPCHRVIASSGALTGYVGGLKRKAYLLQLEKSQLC